MFILSKLSDVVKLTPSTFATPTLTALSSAINAKFSNRVIHNIGLCICLFDILQLSDGTVKAGDGCSYVNVVFRLIVFRPFVGEVITGTIQSSNESGIRVTLGFFDDIEIPANLLFPGCEYDKAELAWVWRTEDNVELYLDHKELIRFRVEEEEFIDCSPGKKGEISALVSPYSLKASCQISGLGLVQWWED